MNYRGETKRILEQIGSNSSELNGRGKTTAIYPVIKDILLDAVSGVPVDTQLPPIRIIAETLSITPVPVQRAINELVADGILYAKPKLGVFVNNPILPVKPASKPKSSLENFQDQISFATESVMPFQRQFWDGIASEFTRKTPASLVDIAYNSNLHDCDFYDVFEVISWKKNSPDWGDEFLDMREAGLDFGLSEKIWDFQEPPYWLPIYYRSHFLFYNKDILKKYNVPYPDYTDIEGQLRYCEMVSKVQKTEFSKKPYMTYYPISIFGQASSLFHRCLVSKDDKLAEQQLKTAVNRLQKFYEHTNFRFSDDDPKDLYKDFTSKTSPFYWGGHFDFWLWSLGGLNFDWGVYPCLNVDNTLAKCPVYVAINRKSTKPIECFRLIEFLLEPANQRNFMDTGAFPLDSELINLPRFDGDKKWLKTLFENSEPIDFKECSKLYLEKNIINTEFWRAAIQEISWEQAVDNTFKYAKYYLKSGS